MNVSVICPKKLWHTPQIRKDFVFAPSCTAETQRTSTSCANFKDMAVEKGFLKQIKGNKKKRVFHLFCGDTLESAVLKSPVQEFKCAENSPSLIPRKTSSLAACIPPPPTVSPSSVPVHDLFFSLKTVWTLRP